VLLVEDDVAMAEMYRIRLSADGHRVRVATDGPTGLREALDRPPQVALIDLRLPGFDGLELLERLRQDIAGARVPVIVLSNWSEPELTRRCAELGALAYLIKSQTTPPSLVETMCYLLSGAQE
jgi:DNA-binding response OmpR family regulator